MGEQIEQHLVKGGILSSKNLDMMAAKTFNKFRIHVQMVLQNIGIFKVMKEKTHFLHFFELNDHSADN